MDPTPNQDPSRNHMDAVTLYKTPNTKKSPTNALRTRTACIIHRSNLENILQQFPYMCGKIETIETHIRPPRWTPTVRIKIETTKDDAKNQTQTCLDATTATIYVDGSGIENKIGAAAYNAVTNEIIYQNLESGTIQHICSRTHSFKPSSQTTVESQQVSDRPHIHRQSSWCESN